MVRMLYHFLKTLYDSGQPEVEIAVSEKLLVMQASVSIEDADVVELLTQCYKERCTEFPREAPEFDAEAAIWGAKVLFLLSSMTAFREIEVSEVEAGFQYELPNSESAAAHFSADLALYYLPDLQEIVMQIADGDPLLGLIDKVALKVPLSSVGMKLSRMPDLTPIYEHVGVEQYHAERVESRVDNERYSVPEVESFIRKLSGNYPSLISKNLIKK